MRTNFVKLLLTAVFAAAVMLNFGISPARAQQAPAAVVIVVDFARVTQESLAGKDIAAQLQSHGARMQTRANELQKGLQAEQQEIASKREVVSPDVFENMLKEFQTKRQSAAAEIEGEQQARQLALQQANSELESALRPIVRQLMQEKRANLVLDKNVVFDQLDGLDVTTQVIERLNRQLPSLKVSLSN